MSKILLITTFVWLSIFLSCKVSDVEHEDLITEFNVINETDSTFVVLRVRENGSTSWLFTESRNFGYGSHKITPKYTMSLDKRYDIQLETDKPFKNTATMSNITLIQSGEVYFQMSNFDDSAIANQVTRIKILNNSKVDFFMVSIRESGSTTWQSIQGNFPKESEPVMVTIGRTLSASKKYDVWLREQSTGGTTAQKNNISLTQDKTIPFGQDDLN